MTHSDPTYGRFAKELADATSQTEVFAALYRLSHSLMPIRLWTIMTVDLDAGITRRAFSNMPQAYPTSGTKPIIPNAWFDIVSGQRKIFVANTLAGIAQAFPDHALIGSLGCASVMNLPVVEGDSLLATVNLLDEQDHFTDARVDLYSAILADPAALAVRKARRLARAL